MMAEAQADNDDEMFVYTGGDQVVPYDVRRVRIDKSVKIIPTRAFDLREHLIDVDFHDGIEMIGEWAFYSCTSLRSVQLFGVKIIGEWAFANCSGLTDIKFGSQLERIEGRAFSRCFSLSKAIMPSLKIIGEWAFNNCQQLTDLDLPEGLETIEVYAFYSCLSLGRIAMPLDFIIGADAFIYCPNLTTVNLVGGVHNTVASLHLQRWRNEMKDEINRMNQVLPNTTSTAEIQQWMESVTNRMSHFKAEHIRLLKEATTLLELALWKAKIEENEEDALGDVIAKKAKIDIQSKRSERRITSGANIIIKNILPFLNLK